MDLYYPPKPKSKLEEYNLKLKERELYTNNILDRFTQNGNGAPIKDEKGNLMTRRKAILENIKHIDEDFSKSQDQNIYNKENIILNYDKNIDNDEIEYNQNNEEYDQNYIDNNEENYINNNEKNILENTIRQNRLTMPIQANSIQLNRPPYNFTNNGKIQPEQKEVLNENNENTIKDNEENYQGIGIIPRVSDFSKIKQKMRLDNIQDDLAKAIEEKRIKAEKEKQKQLELDLKEDLKIKKAIEEEQLLLKLEKKKKEEEENRLMMINLQNKEKNKKKKNLIDIDEYYGKDFRTYKQNKNKAKNENETTGENNYVTSDTNNGYNELIPENPIIKSMKDIEQTKMDTLQAINNFNINVYKNRNILENDIKKLRKEVRSQYIEMNDLFNQLKDTSDQVDYTNNSLLQKSRLLKEQLLQSKITNTLNKNLIGRNYDQNMNVNAEELEIKNNLNPNLVSKNSNLPGTSDFIYFNNDNNFIENDMSYLAKTGMNIIELKGEGEMIPINDENKENKEEEKKEFAGDKFMSKLNDLDYLRKKQFYEDMHKECKMEDLYKDLEDIENINKKLTPMNKINTIRSNFSVDYNRLLNKGKKMKEKFKN